MAERTKPSDEASSQQVQITFQPTGRSVRVHPGTSVLEAAGRCGLVIDTPCGGEGTCGKCRVRFVSGVPEPSDPAAELLSEADITAGWRLACQASIHAPAVVGIPETSLFTEQLQILTQSETVLEFSQGGPPHKDLPVPLAPGERNFAVAFDVGTTTLVGELLDLPDGAERAIAAGINPQVNFGDDVVTRIGHASQNRPAADELRNCLLGAVNTLVDELCEKTGAKRTEIRAVSFSGNTTMQHLLCGLDVSNLAHLPFAPERTEAMDTTAAELGIPIAKGARAYVMPVIGGFVGGDTVCGILTRRLVEQDGPVVMIDIGTNGEIVLAVDGELRAASAAAGPAFEGARITCGMRAADGAIEKVVVDGDLRLSVIGGVEPIGLCGSALVDVAAVLLRCGIMDSMGRLAEQDQLPEKTPQKLRDRLRKDQSGQLEFVLSYGQNTAVGTEPRTRPDVFITQRDIRELQLATGAIRAGVTILLKQANLTPSDLRSVLIAGGFGSFIRRNNAQRIGLIPADVPADRVSYVGNVSLHGAKWVLVSSAARRRAEQLARQTNHVELSADVDFQMAFADSMIFPEK